MKLGIIETGKLVGVLAEKYDPHPIAFQRLLGPLDPDLDFATWSAVDGDVPTDPNACDAWLITGSRHGVYEDHPWMAPLTDFARRTADADKRMIGVCFGHQFLAQAFGGTAVKSDKGWGSGAHTYTIRKRADWMVTDHEEVSVVVAHQDQVVEPPPGAETLGGNTFCEHGIMTIGDTVMTMQFHPEMTKTFARDLIDVRRDLMGDTVADAARDSLEKDLHSDDIAKWMLAFLNC